MTLIPSEIFLNLSFTYQEDDMDGIHIVAFAEEEDPGEPKR